jgi:hypothetical protein
LATFLSFEEINLSCAKTVNGSLNPNKDLERGHFRDNFQILKLKKNLKII